MESMDIIGSYNEMDEKNRLQSTKARRVEFISTIEALKPWIKPNDKILDCGCGAGIYSIYYASKGFSVTAMDIVPKHIDKLKDIIKNKNLSVSPMIGNATDLSRFKNESFDMVLCMGPLYHLISDEEQEKCINECKRVVKSGGYVAFAYISPYSVFPCVIRGDMSRISSELVNKIIDEEVISSLDKECFWTDNHYHTPEKIIDLFHKKGFLIIDHLATDGQSIAFQSVINKMDDKNFSIWLDYHRKVCRIPSMLGSSNHGLVIVRKR